MALWEESSTWDRGPPPASSCIKQRLNAEAIAAVSQDPALKPHNSVSPYMSLVPPKPLSLCRILEECLRVRGCLVFLSAFRLTQMDGISANFHSQVLCGLLFQALVLHSGWGAWGGAETTHSSVGTSAADIFPLISTAAHGIGPAHLVPLILFPVWSWLLLYNFSYRISV